MVIHVGDSNLENDFIVIRLCFDPRNGSAKFFLSLAEMKTGSILCSCFLSAARRLSTVPILLNPDPKVPNDWIFIPGRAGLVEKEQ